MPLHWMQPERMHPWNVPKLWLTMQSHGSGAVEGNTREIRHQRDAIYRSYERLEACGVVLEAAGFQVLVL